MITLSSFIHVLVIYLLVIIIIVIINFISSTYYKKNGVNYTFWKVHKYLLGTFRYL